MGHTYTKKKKKNCLFEIQISLGRLVCLFYFATSGNPGVRGVGLSGYMHQRALLLAQEAGRAGLSKAERSMSARGGRTMRGRGSKPAEAACGQKDQWAT